MPFNKKGQGSLEYLLIIGGGILVAVVIIGAIVSLAGSGTGGSKANVANQTCHTYLDIGTANTFCYKTLANGQLSDLVASVTTTCPESGGTATPCCWDSTKGPGLRCYANPTNVYS